MKAAFFCCRPIALALCLTPFALHAQKGSWAEYLGAPDSSHYSPLKQWTKSNVNKIQTAWTFDTGDETAYTFSPLVVDNVAYVAAKNGALVALDATTGKEIWTHTFGSGGRFSGIAGQRGANYWQSKDGKDRRVIVTSAGALHAIDARTGKPVDTFGDHGKVDLKLGIDRATGPLASRTPGRVFENMLIVGSATGEGYLAPPGDIRAFDVVTGDLKWVFHTIPRPGEPFYDTWPKDAYKYMGGVTCGAKSRWTKSAVSSISRPASAKYELYGGDRPA